MAARKRKESRLREKPQQIADELRALIVAGELSEGDSLGHEPDLVERFGVSRPSLREALRILETEGLVTVVRGVRGGVVVHEPNERTIARAAALVLQARHVSLADVVEARRLLEPTAARSIATARARRAAVKELRALVGEEEAVVGDSERFGVCNAEFHERLAALGGNRTLSVVIGVLNEIVVRAVTAVGRTDVAVGSVSSRRREVRSQARLLDLIEAGDANGAEEHWRSHMQVVGKVMLGSDAAAPIGFFDHHD